MRRTHAEFSQDNTVFKQTCLVAGVKLTLRQASKFRRKKGLAYSFWSKNRHVWNKIVREFEEKQQKLAALEADTKIKERTKN